MKTRKNVRGYFFTMAVVLLMIPLIFFVVYYVTISKTKTDDTVGKIRCDELHYFIEDVRKDLSRAIIIFGRRGAIYALNNVVTTGAPLANYTFNCTSMCDVDCSRFDFGINGSEAAIGELVLCGTLYGENVTYMINHTLREWTGKMEDAGEGMKFSTNITIKDLKVLPYDAWNFSVRVNVRMEVSDETGMCYYLGENDTIESYTSIVGLEDPLYPLNTDGRVRKYIENCNVTPKGLSKLAACSTEDWGNGSATGYVVFYSNIKDDPGLGAFCSTNESVNDIILVFDMAFGACTQLEENCFNTSHPDHLAGVIEYAKNNPNSSFVDKCNVMIPWISATGKIDNETQQGQGHQRDPDCAEYDISTGDCIELVNNMEGGCNVHNVMSGTSSQNVNTTCYHTSNTTEYTSGCTGDFQNGPSFFDRLDGSLSLNEKYSNQSLKYYNTNLIGIETFVSVYSLVWYDVKVYPNATWVDYLYWQDASGCNVRGACSDEEYRFKLDCPHAHRYNISTECVNASLCY